MSTTTCIHFGLRNVYASLDSLANLLLKHSSSIPAVQRRHMSSHVITVTAISNLQIILGGIVPQAFRHGSTHA